MKVLKKILINQRILSMSDMAGTYPGVMLDMHTLHQDGSLRLVNVTQKDRLACTGDRWCILDLSIQSLTREPGE